MSPSFNRRNLLCFVALVWLLIGHSPATLRADNEPADEALNFKQVEKLLRQHCYSCHAQEDPEGELRIDMLDPSFSQASAAESWANVRDRLKFGDMPPESEPELATEDRKLLLAWIAQQLREVEVAPRELPAFRRLTRREYQQTMQDLIGLPIEFESWLPEDGKSKSGFRNDGDVLRMSPLQYETFLKIADEALDAAIVSGPPPVVHRYRFTASDFEVETLPKPENRPGSSYDYDAHPFEIVNMGAAPQRPPGGGKLPPAPPHPPDILPPSKIVRFREAAVRPPKSCIALRMHEAFRGGETVIKIHAARIEPAEEADAARVPVLKVAMGSTNYHGVELKSVGEPVVIDHTDPRTYEIHFRMENVSVPNVGPLNRRNATILAVWNSAPIIEDEEDPPQLKIEWIELENPFLASWPPKTHTDIFFERAELDEAAYAREVLRRFATRAYRSPLSTAELDRLAGYWRRSRANTDSLDESLRETLSVVLSSPRFLGLPVSRSDAKQERLTSYELASRLSYFLWSTMPDEELLRLASKGELNDPVVLSTQVQRMIQDDRSWAFIEQFSEQWLELDRLQRVVVNSESYPGFDERLASAMRLESIHFFGEVLRDDLSIFQFLGSDFTCVNDVLAAHYGIGGVVGPHFRRVPLQDRLHRSGGLLTHGSILTGLSDGNDGHPIKRGVWLLRNLLDDPPPPPPPNVPELDREDPELEGLTIPQALAQHRNDPSCMGCHQKIDPWGIAFEEYDAVGRWQRDGKGASLRQKRTQQPIDSNTTLPNGVQVSGLVELRAELVRSRSDDFRRAMLRKVMAYALGRTLTPGDIETADSLLPALRHHGDSLSALVDLIVTSESFQSK